MRPVLDNVPVRPYPADVSEGRAALRKALKANPRSTRALAQAAGVSEKLLRMIRDGDRGLTPRTRDALAAALRRWEARCADAAEALEAADLAAAGGDDA